MKRAGGVMSISTLVIHPEDKTTDFLKEVYRGLDCKVIRKNLIFLHIDIRRYDRIIMLGHGSPQGLWKSGSTVLTDIDIQALKNKECVAIWCHADEFMRKHRLKGFYTGMFISEKIEAILYKVKATREEITYSNFFFAQAVNKYINTQPKAIIKEYKNLATALGYFNSSRLRYRNNTIFTNVFDWLEDIVNPWKKHRRHSTKV